MKMKSESEVTQLCLTLSDPMDWGPPGSSVHGILQARVLEWGAIAFSVPNIRLDQICGPFYKIPNRHSDFINEFYDFNKYASTQRKT